RDSSPRESGLFDPSRSTPVSGPTLVTTPPPSTAPTPVQTKTPAASTSTVPAPTAVADKEKTATPAPAPVRIVEPPPSLGSAFPSESPRLSATSSRTSRDEESEMQETYTSPWAAARESAVNRPRIIAAAVVAVALMSGGVFAARRYFSAPATTVPVTGTVVVNTDPAGAAVVSDGEAHGATPVTATLKTGPHTIELSTKDGVRRTMTVNVTANQQLSQFIEMPKAAAGTGDLQVRTDPPGARVV